MDHSGRFKQLNELRPDKDYSEVFKDSLPQMDFRRFQDQHQSEPNKNQAFPDLPTLGLFEGLESCWSDAAGRHHSSHCDESSRGGSGDWHTY